MASFVDMIYTLQEMGLADVLIPFFLTFSVVFGVLAKTSIFGSNAKRFNVIVAMALGFAVVIPHVIWGTFDPTDAVLVTGQTDVVEVINNSLPSVAVIVIAIVMLLLMLGVFGVRWKLSDSPGGSIIVMLALLIVIYIFGYSAGWFRWWQLPYFLEDPETQALIVTLLVFGIVVWLITREDKDDSGKEKFEDKIKKYFKLEDLE